MIDKELLNMWDRLSSRDQDRVADLIEMLSRKEDMAISESSASVSTIEDEPFFGMWSDRDDMKDSTEYIRKLRTTEWG